jgi:hypothetical protein
MSAVVDPLGAIPEQPASSSMHPATAIVFLLFASITNSFGLFLWFLIVLLSSEAVREQYVEHHARCISLNAFQADDADYLISVAPGSPLIRFLQSGKR